MKNRIISLILRIIPRSILDSFLNSKFLNFGIYFSQEGEDILLEAFLPKDTGFYVDVGAHHPHRYSVTHKKYITGWRGINIDANPDCMKFFNSFRKRDINLNVGISDEEEMLTYYRFNEPALNTFSEDRKNALLKNTDYRILDTLKIKVRRLDSVLREFMPTNTVIDFMNIDVEGLEMAILKSNDWNLHSPTMILLEDVHYGLQDVRQNPCHTFLLEKGYRLVSKTRRTLFYTKA